MEQSGCSTFLLTLLLAGFTGYKGVEATNYHLPNSSYTVLVGDDLVMPCGVSGAMAANFGVFWQDKDTSAQYIPTESFFESRANVLANGTLVLTDLQVNDTSVLICVLVNPLVGTTIERTSTLNVDEPPPTTVPPTTVPTSPPITSTAYASTIPAVTAVGRPQGPPDASPRNVTVDVIDDTHIRVNWKEALVSRIQYRVTAYGVLVRELYDIRSLPRRYQVATTGRSFLVPDLKPSTKYVVFMVAGNPEGDSRKTDEVIVKTFEKGYGLTTPPSTAVPSTRPVPPTPGTPVATTAVKGGAQAGKQEIFGLSLTVFGVIVGVVVMLLVALVVAGVLYRKKSKKLNAERSRVVGSQVDMIREGRYNVSPWPTPHKSPAGASMMDMNGVSCSASMSNVAPSSTYSSQYSSQQNVCGVNVNSFSPQRRRKMPRPGGVPPLSQTDGPQVSAVLKAIEANEDDEYQEMEHHNTTGPLYAGLSHTSILDESSNMSTLQREEPMFQYEAIHAADGMVIPLHAADGMVIPPPPARTPPPLQIADYPQSFYSFGSTLGSPKSHTDELTFDAGISAV